MELITLLQNAGGPRKERLDGREYLVVPITSIVPGVLPGSRGPLLYPPDEVARNPHHWDNVPLTMFHPLNNGRPSSVRDGDALERHGIGFARRSQYNGKLQHEGWYDVEKVRQAEKQFGVDGILNKLEKGEPIETSTGLYTDDEPAPKGAHHNGRVYDYVARNYRPDHIALLPNQKGACSINDGCGINVNQIVLRNEDTHAFEGKTCMKCGANFSGRKCPKCGTVAVGVVENATNDAGGEKPNISLTVLKKADFVTLPEDVEGTNCSNCRFESGGVCENDMLKGQNVNEHNCCAYWDADGTVRDWSKKQTNNQGGVGIDEMVLTLMHAATGAHLLHLQTRSFAAHSALDEMYKALPEFADAIAESWQGKHEIIANYSPGFQPPSQPEPFVNSLIDWFKDARAVLDDETELQNIADEIQGFLDKTLYKLRYLS